jgi:hypothetical protein
MAVAALRVASGAGCHSGSVGGNSLELRRLSSSEGIGKADIGASDRRMRHADF